MTAVSWIVAVAALAATAYVLGRRVAGWSKLGLSFQDRLERDAVSAALGLALLAHLLLLLGLAGLLRPGPVLLLVAAVHIWGFPVWRERIAEIRPRPVWLLAALALPLFLLPLYPPTGFDATMYHLPFARSFAESGGMPFLPDLRFPVFPQANEILFAAAMLFGGDVAAQGVQLFAALLTAGLLVVWGRGTWNPAAGWLAAAVFLGNPVVVHLAGTAYIEPGLALFITAGIFALDRWRLGGGRSWLALAAAFTATAADVKYLGLFFLGVAGLVAIFAVRSRPVAARCRDALLFSAVAAAFLAPWYLRIYLHTGNPLFPYLSGLFGSDLWTAPMSPHPGEMSFGQLVRLARLPWDLVFERQRAGGQPPFSPVYLAALPLLAVGFCRDFRVRFPLLIAGAFGLVWTRLPPDSRYLLTVLPLASLAVAGAAAPWIGRSRFFASRRGTALLCLGCFLPGWLYAGYRVHRQGPPPVTAEGREAYLARALPVHPALAHLNRTRGRGYTVWALHAENMVYFADGRFLGDWVGAASFPRVLAASRDAGSFHHKLRRLGVTHLLIPARLVGGGAGATPVPEDAAFRRWFRLVYQDPGARVYELK
ncbi:MAG TPA: phospholipid carrier-dependent glycosyltransferase [Thermoanaerobaculia bacterium]